MQAGRVACHPVLGHPPRGRDHHQIHRPEIGKRTIRWIRSDAVTEEDGRVGSVCIYAASDPEAIHDHGRRIGAPSDDIRMVRGTAIKRDDPQPVTQV